MAVEDVDFLVTHQPVSWAANAWREAIGVPVEKFHETFQENANVANCSTGVNLLDAIEKGKIKEGDNVLITSSGAGENHIAVLMKAPKKLIENLNK